MLPAPQRTAAIAFLAYFTTSWIIGEQWPFSRYAMYATVERDSFAPVTRVDGKRVRLESLHRFTGCDNYIDVPPGIPSRTGWRSQEMHTWIANRRSDTPGPVAFEIVMSPVVIGEDGPYIGDESRPVCQGTAHWRNEGGAP